MERPPLLVPTAAAQPHMADRRDPLAPRPSAPVLSACPEPAPMEINSRPTTPKPAWGSLDEATSSARGDPVVSTHSILLQEAPQTGAEPLLGWVGAQSLLPGGTTTPRGSLSPFSTAQPDNAVTWRHNVIFQGPEQPDSSAQPSHAAHYLLSSAPDISVTPGRSCTNADAYSIGPAIKQASRPARSPAPSPARSHSPMAGGSGCDSRDSTRSRAITLVLRTHSEGSKALAPRVLLPSEQQPPLSGPEHQAGSSVTRVRNDSPHKQRVAAADNVISLLHGLLSGPGSKTKEQPQTQEGSLCDHTCPASPASTLSHSQSSRPSTWPAAGWASGSTAAAGDVGSRMGGAQGAGRVSLSGGDTLKASATAGSLITPRQSNREPPPVSKASSMSSPNGGWLPVPRGYRRSPALSPDTISKSEVHQASPFSSEAMKPAYRSVEDSRVICCPQKLAAGGRSGTYGVQAGGHVEGVRKETLVSRRATALGLVKARSEGAKNLAPRVLPASVASPEESKLGRSGSDNDGRRRQTALAADSVIMLTRDLVSGRSTDQGGGSFTSSSRRGSSPCRTSDKSRTPVPTYKPDGLSLVEGAGGQGGSGVSLSLVPLDSQETRAVDGRASAPAKPGVTPQGQTAVADPGLAGITTPLSWMSPTTANSSRQTAVWAEPGSPGCVLPGAPLGTGGRCSGAYISRPSRLSAAARVESLRAGSMSGCDSRAAASRPSGSAGPHCVMPITAFMKRSVSFSGALVSSVAEEVDSQVAMSSQHMSECNPACDTDALARMATTTTAAWSDTRLNKAKSEGAQLLGAKVMDAKLSGRSISGGGALSRSNSLLKSVWQGLGIKTWFKRTSSSSPKASPVPVQLPGYTPEGGAVGLGAVSGNQCSPCLDVVQRKKSVSTPGAVGMEDRVKSVLKFTRALLQEGKARQGHGSPKQQRPTSVR